MPTDTIKTEQQLFLLPHQVLFYSSENSAHSPSTQERTCVLNFQHESSAVKSNLYVYMSTYMGTSALLSTWHFSQHHRLAGERLPEKLTNSYTTKDSPQSLHFLIFSLSLPCSCYLHPTVFWSKPPPTTVFLLFPQAPICLKRFLPFSNFFLLFSFHFWI